MGTISCHIMPLVINSLAVEHTCTHTHTETQTQTDTYTHVHTHTYTHACTDVHTETILRNQARTGLRLAHSGLKL